ncbi:hypothetical protein RI054_01g00380 [Pseudoscourfieldia marina]
MFFSWHGSAPPPPLSRRARPCLRAYSASFAGARVSEQSAARVMFARDGVFADGGEVEGKSYLNAWIAWEVKFPPAVPA